MTQITRKDTKRETAPDEEAPQAEASPRGHSGEGAASVMAQLILQGEKHPREEEPSGGHAG